MNMELIHVFNITLMYIHLFQIYLLKLKMIWGCPIAVNIFDKLVPLQPL